MSDDRFKQARKSLIDRNRKRQKQSGDSEPEEYDEDEATQMVNLDRLQSGGPPPNPERNSGGQRSGQQRGSDPGGAPSPGPGSEDAFGQDDYDPEEATQMFEIPEDGPPTGGGVQIGGGGSAPSENTAPSRDALDPPNRSRGRRGGSRSNRQNSGRPAPPPQPESSPGGHSQGPGSSGPGSSGQQGSNQQFLSPGGGAESGHEGKTDFINIDDFASGATEFTPEESSAGYEGSTQFVSIDALTSGGPQGGSGGGIENDPVLNQGYQFGPNAIQRGDVTLIFAQNALGKDIVLRQIWEGDPSNIPAEMRQRIGELDELSHPNLVSLTGVFASKTGLWAELERPDGFRLTAVLEQHGAQEEENVIDWMTTVAEVLDLIHDHDLIYASLTPNAIWIQEDNSVILEPFDVLSFEHRGDLGPFGPPELAKARQGTQLHPATDVFSFAAVTTAALTGLPFDPMRLQHLDNQKTAEALKGALKQNPEDRPQRASEVLESASGGGLPLNPEDWDIKIVAGIAIVILLGFTGFMYWRQQNQIAPPPKQQSGAAQQAGEKAGASAKAGDPSGGATETSAPAAGTATNARGEPAKADPPGDILPDPRVMVHSSYQFNPPAEESTSTDPASVKEKTNRLRKEAREAMEGTDDLAKSERKRIYREALANLTEAIRLSGQKTAEDEELLDELESKEVIQQYKDRIRKDVQKALREGDVGEARFSYRKWASIDPGADAATFFEKVSSPEVRFISKIDDKDSDE